MPPIKAYNIDVKTLNNSLKGKIGSDNYYIHNLNRNVSNIITTNNESYNDVKNILKDLNKQYFTYTPKDLKPLTLILGGIHRNYNIEEVTAELKSLKFKSESTRITTIKVCSQQKKFLHEVNPQYIVQFSPTSIPTDIKQITHILHQKVYWTLPKSNGLPQCYRCQRYGHTATNCEMAFRCVKCSKDHGPKLCPLNEKKNKNLMDLVLSLMQRT